MSTWNAILAITGGTLLSISELALPSRADDYSKVSNDQSSPFRLGLQYLAQPIANPAGGTINEFSWLNGLWLQIELGRGLNLDKDQWNEIDHWVLKLETAAVRGNSGYYRQIGATYPLQSMTSSGQWLSELTIRREAGEGGVSMKTGIFSLNPGFMENEAFNFYIHSAINDTFNNEVLGIPIAPLTSLGMQWTIGNQSHARSHQLRVGAFTVVPSNTFGQSVQPGTRPLNLQGAVGLLQWQYGLENGDISKTELISIRNKIVEDQLPKPGIMIGGYWSQTSSQRIALKRQARLPQGLNRGLYGTATIDIPPSIWRGVRARAWIAGQYGFDWHNNPAPTFYGAGLLLQGLLPNRPLDVTGIGGASTGFSPFINPGQDRESLLEINHQIQISQALSLKPFAQLILTPSGISGKPPILATGIQASIRF